MALVFPSSPNVDDVYLGWRWDGTKWTYVSGVAGVAGVSSYNTRSGAVTSVLADVTTVTGIGATAQSRLGLATVAATGAYADLSGSPPTDVTRAPLDSPPFTGNPTAPTPAYGDNDTSIATTAFVQSAVAPVANNVGRNLLHNSMFNVAQRGAGPWTVGDYTMDRWMHGVLNDTISVTQTVLSDADRSQLGDESARFCSSNTFTGNATGTNNCSQPIEDVRRLAGKTITISFWARSPTGLKLGVSIDQGFGTGGSPSADVLGNGAAVTLNSTFTRYNQTVTVPGVSGKTLGTNNNNKTSLVFWYSASSSFATRTGSIGVQSGTIQLWGVQLEIGSVATPLEKPDPQVDLANCQRFYQTGLAFFSAYQSAGANVNATVMLPVTMRSAPTIALGTPSFTNTAALSTSPAPGYVAMWINATATGNTAVNCAFTASADL